MATLSPAPNGLGLDSPALGPWFSADETIPLPASGELAIDMRLGDGGEVSWLPPANGLFSLFVATSSRPRGLSGYRDVDGAAAFADGNVVAVFRLLAGVEERLDALAAVIPSASTQRATGATFTRPRVRAIAMELPDHSASLELLESLLPDDFAFPPGITTPEQRAAHLGLTWDGSSLGNGPLPMTDLRQPGMLLTVFQSLLTFRTDSNVRLWAFDHRGRPLDAGAVAAWWNFMATDPSGFDNLWAFGVVLNQRTATVASGRTIHLVNAHEGPLDAPASRVTVTGATGGGAVWRETGTQGVTVTIADPGTVDDFPRARAAVLPDGLYVQTPGVWGSGGPSGGLQRDFARVAVTSIELQLVGQPRSVPDTSTEAAKRRAADQDRDSTGVRPARALRPALLATNEPVLTTLVTQLTTGSATTLVASAVQRDAGAVAFALPVFAPPTARPTITVRALEGGGVEQNGVVLGQRVLVDVQVAADSSFQNAWVRVWPQGYDPVRGEHVRLDGGGAPVNASGVATMVVPLADGAVSHDDPPRLGLDVWVSTLVGPAHFADLHFDRPFPATRGTRVPLGEALGPFLVCSTGVVYASSLPNGSVPSGSEVVALGGTTPQLVDRATIPDVTFAAAALVNQLAPADVVELTAPAWRTQVGHEHAAGDRPAAFSGTGASVREQARQPFGPGGAWTAGYPLPGMERLEVVAADPALGMAAVGATPLVGALHDLNFHFHGHPGAPAAPEVHGTGVSVGGSAAVQVAEYTRDRAINGTVALAQDAWQNPISDPNTPADSLWAAGLRTEAAGVAAEIGLQTLEELLGTAYPFGGTWQDIQDALGIDLGPTPIEPGLSSATRALDRRMLAASRGAREGATALSAAIARAEDFVYIETPAFDSEAFGATGDQVDLWGVLRQRMDDNPALQVALCVPVFLMPGAPAELQRVRDELVALAQAAILDEAPTDGTVPTRAERFVVFSPAAGPGRSLRLASTTVVIDDAFAMTGTTHLWRRGLSFDSSYAVAVFDERTQRGRPQEIATFRQTLMAGALGLPATDLPGDPVEAIAAIRKLVERGGLGRLAAERIRPPDPALSTVDEAQAADVTDRDIWNPDGSFPDLDPFSWLFGLRTAVYDDVFNQSQA